MRILPHFTIESAPSHTPAANIKSICKLLGRKTALSPRCTARSNSRMKSSAPQRLCDEIFGEARLALRAANLKIQTNR
jgi:hypothetical protein